VQTGPKTAIISHGKFWKFIQKIKLILKAALPLHAGGAKILTANFASLLSEQKHGGSQFPTGITLEFLDISL